MNFLLGIDNQLLKKTGTAEKSGYWLVNILFIGITLLSLIANGYFGYLLLRNWSGVLLIGLLMGFIQFSILRIALITLMTKPLYENNTSEIKDIKGRLLQRFSSILSFPSVLRFLFTGLIAISISFPLTISIFHDEAMAVEHSFRLKLSKNSETEHPTIGQMDTIHSNYPFVILKHFIDKPPFRTLVSLLMLLIFSPLLVLGWLRYGKGFIYTDLSKDFMRRDIIIEYQECLEQSQYFLKNNFPDFKPPLEELIPFSDMPFKTQKKVIVDRKYGTKSEFKNFIQSL